MRARLTDELLDRARAAPHRQQAYLFDTELPCFGVVLGKRVQTFIVQFRDSSGTKRRHMIGHRGPEMDVATARERAREALATRRAAGRTRLRQAEQRLHYAIRDYLVELARAELGDIAIGMERKQ